ncbi:recombination-associated protein RdgC [Fastidiosibacter lacustris]|uniref:recombination-associated protein RdgC n=1 Tax=Fastidiosibacter lacustris TaxID=2056695 RepID=UPI000E348B71|nr:recombination-associated protein RdgC [Fastidiosibacter lacustris]
MWFKNLALFQFTEKFELSVEEVEKQLTKHAFVPCSTSAPLSMGWVSPLAGDAPIIHAASGFMMIAFQIQEKIVPAGVIKEILDEKVEEIELRESRKVKKKEKDTLKEEIYQNLLPRAFTKNSMIYAYIDTSSGWLVVNASSAKKAELLTVNLRKALGSLKIRIPEILPISILLTQWLQTNQYPQELTIEDQCVLQDNKDASGIIRCQRQNLFTEDILSLIASGREVIQLGLSWQDQLSFVINDEFMIKSLKFLEIIQDKASDIVSETKTERFDADFIIMAETLREFITFLMQIFAKESKSVEHNDKVNTQQTVISADIADDYAPWDGEDKEDDMTHVLNTNTTLDQVDK